VIALQILSPKPLYEELAATIGWEKRVTALTIHCESFGSCYSSC
jgi:hypothetical protein